MSLLREEQGDVDRGFPGKCTIWSGCSSVIIWCPQQTRGPDRIYPCKGLHLHLQPLVPLMCLCGAWQWGWHSAAPREGGGKGVSPSAPREKRRPQGSLCVPWGNRLRLSRSLSMPAKLPSCYLICFISPKKLKAGSEKVSKSRFTCSASELDRKLKTICKFKRKIPPLKF